MTTKVLRATARDHDRLAPVLARAFDDDPVVSWVVREDARRPEAMLLYFQMALDLYQVHDHVFMTEGGEGAALWAPPGKWQMGPLTLLRIAPSVLRITGASRVMRALKVIHTMETRHLIEPHYYLYSVGVDPAHQGKGVGGALIRRGLEECDARHLPAYLESSNERNVPIYRHHGFEVEEELQFGPGSPRLWRMYRPARP